MLEKNCLKKINKGLIIFSFFLFCLCIQPSFSILTIDSDYNYTNYSHIEVLPPDSVYEEFINDPEKWNTIFSNPKYLSTNILRETISLEYETLSTNSLSEIADIFNATVYFNNSEYAYSYVKVPNENYENIVNVYKSLGFEVRNVTFLKPHLSESVASMSLPYTRGATTFTGIGVRIAILDSGLDDSHNDFNGRLMFWADVSGDGFINYTDRTGHGTHVASTAAGDGSESSGIYRGVAPGAQLFIWKIADPDGATHAWIVNAINQAINQNVDVISMSFGQPATAALCNNQVTGGARNLFNAVQNAVNRGIVVVMSNGNNGPNGAVSYPACIREVIGVGSTAKKDYPDNSYSPLTHLDNKIPYERKLNINVNSEIVNQFTQNREAIITSLEHIDFYPLDRDTGIHFTISPNSLPATVNLGLESTHKDRPCYVPADVWWDPGQRDKTDDLWNLGTHTTSSYLGVEMLVLPHFVAGGFACCPFDPIPWYYAYSNDFSCTGTPKVCDDFDSDRNACENQAGCFWCGCFSLGDYRCHDIPESSCIPELWMACAGNPDPCNSESRTKWPYRCGTPETTGCTGSWNTDSITYLNVFQKNTPGTKDFVTFSSSRGPAPNGVMKPDVTAPGEYICAAKSSEAGTFFDICGNNRYHAASGTSMATPHVSGVVALMFEAHPTASVCDIRRALFEGAEPAGYGNNFEGHGRVNGEKSINNIIAIRDSGVETCDSYDRGYPDDVVEPEQCWGFNFDLSANQIRDYNCAGVDCDCTLSFDSYISQVSLNGITSGDVAVSGDYITVDVDVENKGLNQQGWWYLGVEFWKVGDYILIPPEGSWDPYRSMRINAFYNGKDGTHGCVENPDPLNADPGSCPSNVDCNIVSESVNSNGLLDVGETIRVRCQAPVSFYGYTTGNERIMLWIHERDLGQDATNDGDTDGDGNIGDWWIDSLSNIAPANVRAKTCRTDAEDSDAAQPDPYLTMGICTDYYIDGSDCRDVKYADNCTDSTLLREYYVSGSSCTSNIKNCKDYNSAYICSSGRCRYNGGGGGGCLIESTKILTPDGYKNIEEIEIGDIVIGYENGKTVETKVKDKTSHFGFWEIYYYEGSWFTDTHKIYPDINKEAVVVFLISNNRKQYMGTVYDVETGTHNYFGENNLLIHNWFRKVPLLV